MQSALSQQYVARTISVGVFDISLLLCRHYMLCQASKMHKPTLSPNIV